jgi:hypothetical protein
MEGYIAPLLFLAVVFVGFGLTHRNGSKGSRGCSGCEDDCTDKTECKSQDLHA